MHRTGVIEAKANPGADAGGRVGESGRTYPRRVQAPDRSAPAATDPGGSSRPVGRLRLSAIAVGAALGVYLPFVAVALTERGLTVTQVGLVMSLGAVGFVVAVPVWGHVADVILGRPRALALVAVGGGLVLAAILADVPPAVTGFLYVAGTMFTAAWMPLNDAITVNVMRDGPGYVRVRLLMSLFYALAAAGAGVVYATTGFSAALGFVAIGGAVVAVVALRLPDVPRAVLAAHAPAPGRGGAPLRGLIGSSIAALAIAPTLPWILVAIALAFLGLNAGNTFIGLRLLELGGNSVDVALASVVSAAVEVPAMLAAGAVAGRIGLRALFVGSALIGAGGAAAWAAADSVGVILVTRSLVGVAFGGMLVASVLTMRSLLPAELQGTGQSLFQATCFGVAAVIANAVGGLVYPHVGYTGLFALCAAAGVAAAIVAWWAYGRTDGLADGFSARGAVVEPVPPGEPVAPATAERR